MAVKLGQTSTGSIYLGSTKISEAYLGSTKVYGVSTPALPQYTVHLKFNAGVTPTFPSGTYKWKISVSPNIWLVRYENTYWGNLFFSQSDLIEVVAANTSGVTSMRNLFSYCYSLTSVPLLDTSSCTDMSYMFQECTNVQSGALALYQQASTQANPPTYHDKTFTNCGRDTVTGAAELAQIPMSWGGTMV